MSKINNSWDDKSDWERQKIREELDRLLRIRKQKEKRDQVPVEERIKDIKRRWPTEKI